MTGGRRGEPTGAAMGTECGTPSVLPTRLTPGGLLLLPPAREEVLGAGAGAGAGLGATEGARTGAGTGAGAAGAGAGAAPGGRRYWANLFSPKPPKPRPILGVVLAIVVGLAAGDLSGMDGGTGLAFEVRWLVVLDDGALVIIIGGGGRGDRCCC